MSAAEDFRVQQFPAEGSLSGTPDAELAALVRDVSQSPTHGVANTPVHERQTFRVATYLQAHPRQEVRVSEVAAATGLNVTQASGVLQKFREQRTDVDRPSRGVYVYTPGKGPGIKAKDGEQETHEPRPKITVPAEPAGQEVGPGIILPPYQPEDVDVEVVEPDAEVFTEVAGLQTSDGRRVVRDNGGVVYAITELT